MTQTTAFFAVKPTGYDPEQVDRYIRLLTEEYSSLVQRYNDLGERYTELEGSQRTALPAESQPAYTAEQGRSQAVGQQDAIAKALVYAELHSKRTIDEAREEAAKLLAIANSEASRILDESTKEATRVLANIQSDASRAKQSKDDAIAEIRETIARLNQTLMELSSQSETELHLTNPRRFG